jgi:hypothetical protein
VHGEEKNDGHGERELQQRGKIKETMVREKENFSKGGKCMHLWMHYNRKEKKKTSTLWREGEGNSTKGRKHAHSWMCYNRKERESFNAEER